MRGSDFVHARASRALVRLHLPMLGRTLLALVVLLSACRTASPRPNDSDAARTKTTISVENQDFPDMTVYAVQNGQRVRLGIAPGHATTVLEIPSYLIVAGAELQFVCDPIGGSRLPVSERINVYPGDQLVLIVSGGG
jgi:hypothetical protein